MVLQAAGMERKLPLQKRVGTMERYGIFCCGLLRQLKKYILQVLEELCINVDKYDFTFARFLDVSQALGCMSLCTVR